MITIMQSKKKVDPMDFGKSKRRKRKKMIWLLRIKSEREDKVLNPSW